MEKMWRILVLLFTSTTSVFSLCISSPGPQNTFTLSPGAVTTISSPGFPYEYSDRTGCTWIIKPNRANQSLGYRFSRHFNLEKSRDCRMDYVALKRGENGFEDKFCGTTAPPAKMLYAGEKLTIVFRTDNSVSYSGFQLRVQLDQIPEAFGTSVEDDSGDKNYADEEEEDPVSRATTGIAAGVFLVICCCCGGGLCGKSRNRVSCSDILDLCDCRGCPDCPECPRCEFPCFRRRRRSHTWARNGDVMVGRYETGTELGTITRPVSNQLVMPATPGLTTERQDSTSINSEDYFESGTSQYGSPPAWLEHDAPPPSYSSLLASPHLNPVVAQPPGLVVALPDSRRAATPDPSELPSYEDLPPSLLSPPCSNSRPGSARASPSPNDTQDPDVPPPPYHMQPLGYSESHV